MKFYKILFFNTMILGTLISISSYTWLGMWLGLEINLLSIIPLLINNNSYTAEAAIKYFITQALASALIMFSIILFSVNETMLFNNKLLFLIMNSSFLTKMGAAPFHFWFPEVMEGLNWMSSLIMLTWQKIAPLILLMYNSYLSMFLMFVIILNMLISGLMGLNQLSLRKILTFSSINHIGWMIPAINFSLNVWMIYFIIYSMITMNLILMFNYLNLFFIKQMMMQFSNNLMLKLFFYLNFFSLGGLPPFLGFFPKWLIINQLVENNYIILSFLMIIFTLFTLYYYIRLMYSSMTLSNEMIITKFNMKMTWIFMFNFVILLFLPLMILTSSF